MNSFFNSLSPSKVCITVSQSKLPSVNGRQLLLERGYIILYDVVSDEVLNALRTMARLGNLDWNHGTWNGEAFDTMRTRARFPDALSRQMTILLRLYYLSFFPHATMTEWFFLRTMAGAEDQPIRRDFQPPGLDDHAADLATVPGLLLVATQDDTLIYGYGWNRRVALRSNRDELRLNRGDLLMFRGYFMHGNVGYTSNHLLVQGYLDTPNYCRNIAVDQPEVVNLIDDVSGVDDLFCYVYNCPFVASGSTSLRRHLSRFHSFHFTRPRAQNA